MHSVTLSSSARRRNQLLGAVILLLCVFDVTRTLLHFEAPRSSYGTMTVREISELKWTEQKRIVVFAVRMIVLVAILVASISILRRKVKVVGDEEESLPVDRTWDIRLLSIYLAVIGTLACCVFLFAGLTTIQPRVQFAALTTAAISGVSAAWGVARIVERRKAVPLTPAGNDS